MSQAQQQDCLAGPVSLNVGGQIYTTSLSTLTKYSESMLGAMFSERHSLKQDANGNYFIDRDGSLFRYVLEFLRNGQLQALDNKRDLHLLLKEAEFFRIPPLEEAVKQQIANEALQINKASEGTEMVFIKYDLREKVISATGRVITFREVLQVGDAETEPFQIVPYSGQSERPGSSKTGKLTPRKTCYADEMAKCLKRHGFFTTKRTEEEWILSRTVPKQ